ncbi:aminoglycoside phosphotransferase [Streptomyces abyssalis]|uniref:Aminoglycoside phosphotransferase n=1 Tax=Streptomyces abyssalis TaxID=933944 RepID=A0A1E7JQW7_9ACTN|nr:aminoglycoside phosphotransferase family protein [Streptomyces abyssalis]OEU87489.1 aminoglycoside phosphotransferase [Streptomyces abyssalis]OEU90658.1 aminoglycoside phosphotransferase [Streptomyces abyssalis]
MAQPQPFTQARARALLAAAGEQAEHAELLALGENAVFALPGPEPVVVRIGRGPSQLHRAERELRVAAWLEERQVPAVRPARTGVTVVDGHPLTFWQRLPEPVRAAAPVDLAGLLRLVHALPAPPFDLPGRDLLGGVERWLRLAGDAVPASDAAYLRARRDDFAAAVAELAPVLPPGPLHGDALPRNVHIGPDGPLLLDLETFSEDLREHDLVVLALSLDRYGLDEAAYSAFVRAYGFDVREWAGCAVLLGARETAACAWVAQHSPGNPAAGREFARRVASLRDDDAAVRWYAF